MRPGLCGCILLLGLIWGLVVLVCVLGFRGNKPGVVAKWFIGDAGDPISLCHVSETWSGRAFVESLSCLSDMSLWP